MTPASPEALVIGGDTREVRVLIADIEYALRPMTLPQIERFVRDGGSELTAALSSAFAGESTAADWLVLVTDHGPRLRQALHVASEVPQAVIDSLTLAGTIQLAQTVLQVNLDFFVQRVRPALGSLVKTVVQIAQRASPKGSPTASRH